MVWEWEVSAGGWVCAGSGKNETYTAPLQKPQNSMHTHHTHTIHIDIHRHTHTVHISLDLPVHVNVIVAKAAVLRADDSRILRLDEYEFFSPTH